MTGNTSMASSSDAYRYKRAISHVRVYSTRRRFLAQKHGRFSGGAAVRSHQNLTLMAAYGGFRVISFDYRMPPDFP
jgi:hypothetical protein